MCFFKIFTQIPAKSLDNTEISQLFSFDSLYQNYRLHVLREREHVHRLDALYCVALFRKDIKIALQALRAA